MAIETILSIFLSAFSITVFSYFSAKIQSDNRRAKKSIILFEIKLDALTHAIFTAMNGKGEDVKREFDKKKKELINEYNFVDEK